MLHLHRTTPRLCRIKDHLSLRSLPALGTAASSLRQVWTDTPGHAAPESAFYDSTVEQVFAAESWLSHKFGQVLKQIACWCLAVRTAAYRNPFLEAGQKANLLRLPVCRCATISSLKLSGDLALPCVPRCWSLAELHCTTTALC